MQKTFNQKMKQILRQRQGDPGQRIKKVGLEEGGNELFSHAAPLAGPEHFMLNKEGKDF